jgi:3D (Asp-Asp-Asp) domain-containing protein
MLRLLIPLFTTALHAATVEATAIVTAYTPSIEGGGAGTGRTSIGVRTDTQPYGVAADPRQIPYGAWVYIPGYREEPERGGPWWPVDDTGSAMRRATDRGVLHIDLRMRNPWAARQWGTRLVTITIYIEDKP